MAPSSSGEPHFGGAEVFASAIGTQPPFAEGSSWEHYFSSPRLPASSLVEQRIPVVPPLELSEEDFAEIDEFLALSPSGPALASAVQTPSGLIVSEVDWDSILQTKPDLAPEPAPAEIKSTAETPAFLPPPVSAALQETMPVPLASYFEEENPAYEEDDFITFLPETPVAEAKVMAPEPLPPSMHAEVVPEKPNLPMEAAEPETRETPAARLPTLPAAPLPPAKEMVWGEQPMPWIPILVEEDRLDSDLEEAVPTAINLKNAPAATESLPREIFVSHADSPGMDVDSRVHEPVPEPEPEPEPPAPLDKPEEPAPPAFDEPPEQPTPVIEPGMETAGLESPSVKSGELLRSLRSGTPCPPEAEPAESSSPPAEAESFFTVTDAPPPLPSPPADLSASPFSPAVPLPGRETTKVVLPRFAQVSVEPLEARVAEAPPAPSPSLSTVTAVEEPEAAAQSEAALPPRDNEAAVDLPPSPPAPALAPEPKLEPAEPLVYATVPSSLPTLVQPKPLPNEPQPRAKAESAGEARTWHLWAALWLLLALTTLWLIWQGALPGKQSLQNFFRPPVPAETKPAAPSAGANAVPYGLAVDPESPALPRAGVSPGAVVSAPVSTSVSAPVPAPLPVPVSGAASPKDLAVLPARAVLQRFLDATDLEGRLPLVLAPERARAKMEIYDQRNQGRASGGTILEEIKGTSEAAQEHALYLIKTPDRPQGFMAMMARTPNGYRLHWDAFVQARDEALKHFLAEERDYAGSFYVWARRTRRSSTDPDFESVMNCYEVFAPTGLYFREEPVKVYLDRDAAPAASLREFLTWGEVPSRNPVKPVHLQLRWLRTADDEPYVAIEQVVKQAWGQD